MPEHSEFPTEAALIEFLVRTLDNIAAMHRFSESVVPGGAAYQAYVDGMDSAARYAKQRVDVFMEQAAAQPDDDHEQSGCECFSRCGQCRRRNASGTLETVERLVSKCLDPGCVRSIETTEESAGFVVRTRIELA